MHKYIFDFIYIYLLFSFRASIPATYRICLSRPQYTFGLPALVCFFPRFHHAVYAAATAFDEVFFCDAFLFIASTRAIKFSARRRYERYLLSTHAEFTTLRRANICNSQSAATVKSRSALIRRFISTNAELRTSRLSLFRTTASSPRPPALLFLSPRSILLSRYDIQPRLFTFFTLARDRSLIFDIVAISRPAKHFFATAR